MKNKVPLFVYPLLILIAHIVLSVGVAIKHGYFELATLILVTIIISSILGYFIGSCKG